MGRNIRLLGIFGLIVLLFGIIIFGLFSQLQAGDLYYIVEVHLALGVALLSLFLLRGGFSLLGATAAKRAIGFGFGVLGYSALFIALLLLANYVVHRHDPSAL